MKKVIFFALLCLIAIPKVVAQDKIYFMDAPLGTTTYDDFYEIIVANGYNYFKREGDNVFFTGTYADVPAIIILDVYNGYVITAAIKLEHLNLLKASEIRADLLFTFMEEYKNFLYDEIEEGNKTTNMFRSTNGGSVVIRLTDVSTSFEIIIMYMSNVSRPEESENTTSIEDGYSESNVREPLTAKKMTNDWVVSSEFHSEPGFKGSYWHTAMRILRKEDGKYLLTIYKPANNGYYKVYSDENCYLKLDNDSIVTLKVNTEYTPWNYAKEGYRTTHGVYMPKRYFTQAFYDIDDIDILLNHDVTKLRWIIDEKPYDVDYAQKKWVKKFNTRFHDAIKEVTTKSINKSNFKNDNLTDF